MLAPPRKPSRKQVHFFLREEAIERLKRLACAREVSVTRMIELMANWLEASHLRRMMPDEQEAYFDFGLGLPALLEIRRRPHPAKEPPPIPKSENTPVETSVSPSSEQQPDKTEDNEIPSGKSTAKRRMRVVQAGAN